VCGEGGCNRFAQCLIELLGGFIEFVFEGGHCDRSTKRIEGSDIVTQVQRASD
jgi:hypothetical protein